MGDHYYNTLYLFDGNALKKVENIFELDADLPIVAAVGDVIDTRVVVKYRHKLLRQMRERRFTSSLLKHDAEPEFINFAERSQEYERLDELLKKKQRMKTNSYKGRIKYQNPLLDIKVPFIDKSKLVRERQIF